MGQSGSLWGHLSPSWPQWVVLGHSLLYLDIVSHIGPQWVVLGHGRGGPEWVVAGHSVPWRVTVGRMGYRCRGGPQKVRWKTLCCGWSQWVAHCVVVGRSVSWLVTVGRINYTCRGGPQKVAVVKTVSCVLGHSMSRWATNGASWFVIYMDENDRMRHPCQSQSFSE